jgi:L-lactate dehydrogenase complex protein LldG
VSDRESILAGIRAAVAHRVPHPGSHPSPGGPDGLEVFAEAVRTAGGEVHGPVAARELGEAASALAAQWTASGRLVVEASAARLLETGLYEVTQPAADPHAFRDVEVAVVAGCLGVAENGAVAVLGSDAPNRSLLFLAERLILLLELERIVPDLHAAFRALPDTALQAHHLTWISGPSKTADIEQTLVLGAHGPRALAVFVHRG